MQQSYIQKKVSIINLKIEKSVGTYLKMLAADIFRYKHVYIMALPVLVYYLIFHYGPMYGAIIAFKDFNPVDGILGSPWAGLDYFREFINDVYFTRILKNTLIINIYMLVFGFPAPIVLALLLNEIRSNAFKRTIQTVTYLPHFISIMVICGMIIDFTSIKGLVNYFTGLIGMEPDNLLMKPQYFRTIYVITGIWQELGWNSIIYLAALSGINSELYEACDIDGGGKWKQLIHVTIPGILPTIVILLILRMGQMMNVGFEKIILLYNAGTYETADVISSYVYRRGLIDSSYSLSAAVGLFNSVINFVMLLMANWISRKTNETSLW